MDLFSEYGIISDSGKLMIYNQAQFVERIKVFAGQNVEIIIRRRTGTITQQQRKYYFSVLVPEVQRCFNYYGDRLGFGKDRGTVDHWLRVNFLNVEEYHADTDNWSCKYRRLNDAETDVTTREFSQFIDDVILWFIRELDWALPYPNELFEEEEMTEMQKELNKENPFD